MMQLRDVRRDDAEQLREWRNLPEIAAYMYSDHHISSEEHAAWFDRALHDESRRFWIIQLDGEDVGLVNLYDIDRVHDRAAWAFYLASPSVRGRGVGSFVEFTTLEHVFEEMGLHRLTCEVLSTNMAVVEMHEKFGFTVEGRFREHIQKDGEFVDVISLGMLQREWRDHRDAIRSRLAERGIL